MSDLLQRCKEILAWKKTGLLKGDALHSFAKKKWGEDHFALQLAESDTVNEALEALVAQPHPTTKGLIGYMHAGNILELQQGSCAYGYVYPEAGHGVNTPVFTHTPDYTALIQQMFHALWPHELQTHAAEVAIEAARKRLSESRNVKPTTL